MSKIINGAELQDLPHPDYKYVTSTEEALRYLEYIEKHQFIEVDTETTGLDPLTDKIVLLQMGVSRTPFVFDVREGNVDAKIFKPLLEDYDHLKLLQNAAFDYEFLKTNFGIEMNRMYDTMLAEQLIYLGLHNKSNLQYLVAKYLHLNMPKDIAYTFSNYNQKYQEYQLRYAANDVCVLREIYNQQIEQLKKDGLMRVARLEFEFIKPLAEMELNGMLLDVPQWREILDEMMVERDKLRIQLSDMFNRTIDQTTLFGVSTLNLDSPSQVVKCLNDLGIPVESSGVKELNKHKNNSTVKLLLDYRKAEKFITTYGERMIDRIHPLTGRLHTTFKQMVDTGRMSSSDPNLQNIPKQQKYRSCFIARPGYKLITCDMSQAELRILGEFSGDPVFLEAFAKGLDLHSRTASDLFGVSYDDVVRDAGLPDGDPNKKKYRANVKGLNFGLVYGLTKVGLSLRLGVSESEAQNLIDMYFSKYVRVRNWLDQASKFAIINRYSLTVSGRRRYYRLPDPTDAAFNRIKGSVERQGKNHPIQGSNADTIKQAMINTVQRIRGYDARLLSTVHDEVIVEVREDQLEEVVPIVESSVIDGFGEFFTKVKMKADAMVADHWVKD
jgi:DNA polymerase I-like protein with 3'-5' exonuclease and polymerase domains